MCPPQWLWCYGRAVAIGLVYEKADKPMKIHFTKKEYITLLETIQMAGWILHAHRTDQPADRKKYHELEQKILSLAKDFGCDDVVQWDKKLGAHFTTREFEGRIMPFIEEYEEDSFWEELKTRLVDRDVCREVGEQKFSSLGIEERFAKEEPYEQKYNTEFETHGITRLQVVTGPAAMDYAGPVKNN